MPRLMAARPGMGPMRKRVLDIVVVIDVPSFLERTRV